MHDLTYVSGTGAVEVGLDSRSLSAMGGLGIRGREWSYELGDRGISSVARAAREAEVELATRDLAEVDRARRVMDRDVQLGTPGELVWRGEWRTRAYAVKSVPSLAGRGGYRTGLTLVLLDGVWRREATTSYLPSSATGGDWLDYPHGTPYDYMALPAPEVVRGGEWCEVPCRLTIYGPAANPVVTIAGNNYAADLRLQSGSRLVIDGLSREAYEVTSTGLVINRFSSVRRGSGLGSGEYCFQPIPPGESSVEWSGAFGFDLTIWEEEGEPPLT